jgi:hypothetical protein
MGRDIMSDVLDRVARHFDHRMKVRRRALAHLDVVLSDEDTLSLRGELRATLLACQACPDPAICTRWLDGGKPGLPASCRALASFRRLQAASIPAMPEPLRASA